MQITRRAVWTHGLALGAAAGAGVAGAGHAFGAPGMAGSKQVERWGVFELALNGPAGGNPFVDVTLSAVMQAEGAGSPVEIPGFYDGDGIYRIRFSPPVTGRWRWTTRSNAAALDGKSGSFVAFPAGKGNRGPVRVEKSGYHFAHADGTPFRQIGTTSYSWALQSEEKCRQTLRTLTGAPFNKMRMLVFPNVPSVATDPFVRTGHGPRDWDPTRFDPAYFRRYEDRIFKLGQLGIEADVILFHPYDETRGYSDMARADDERYIRYAAARFGAYRNVWWSMANEYDAIESKSMDDWDHLFQVLVAADPHDRLRSIHQIHIYYDHRKPWITHASVQNGAAVLDDIRAELHRAMTLKPVIFDEVVYEGDIDLRWGNLSAQGMVERFWYGLIGGTYVGHSETYSPTDSADQSWLGQGGTLQGESAPRLAFLKQIMEEGPAPGFEPIQPWWNYHLAGDPTGYFMRYFGADTPDGWDVALPAREDEAIGTYRADIIDSWNMTVTPVDGLFRMERKDRYDMHDPARPRIELPGKPWIALRFRKV